MRALFAFFVFLPLLTVALAPDSSKQQFAVVFYNVENFFDTENDSLTADDEFTPEGLRYWNKSRFNKKAIHISKVLLTSCGFTLPSVIGLCEVENAKVINHLCKYTPLKEFQYQSIHYDSPDARGIDVALLYRPSDFIPVYSRSVRVSFSHSSSTTRDILYVKGVLGNADTVHFFVNHWPSKYGGAAATIERRADAAKALRAVCDSLFMAEPDANLIIMGDFNDTPDDPSLYQHLGACRNTKDCGTGLVNMSVSMAKIPGKGTQKHNGRWSVIDQFIVSTSMSKGANVFQARQAEIVWMEMLLTVDETFTGLRPFRTYHGMKYEGGFSDHLPIRIILTKKMRLN